jgi:hypothetical protein
MGWRAFCTECTQNGCDVKTCLCACLRVDLPAGMMGWRVGYIAYPGQQLLQQAGLEQYNLGEQLLKVRRHTYSTVPLISYSCCSREVVCCLLLQWALLVMLSWR